MMRRVLVFFAVLTVALILFIPHSPRWKERGGYDAIEVAPDPWVASSLYARAKGPVLTPTTCAGFSINEKAAHRAYVNSGPFLVLTGCRKTPVLIDERYYPVAPALWNFVGYVNDPRALHYITSKAGIGAYPLDAYGTYSTLMRFRSWKYGEIFGQDAKRVASLKRGVCGDYAVFWAVWLGANGLDVTYVYNFDMQHVYVFHSDTVFDLRTPFLKREFFVYKWYLISGSLPWLTEDVTLASPFYGAFHSGREFEKVVKPVLSYSIVVDGRSTVIGSLNGYEGYRYTVVGGRTVGVVRARGGAFTLGDGRVGRGAYWAFMHLLPPAPVPGMMAFTTGGTTYYYMLFEGHATFAYWSASGGRVAGVYYVDGVEHSFSGVVS